MISIRKLRKSFIAQQGVVNALRDIDLEVAEGDFCVLLGPSGCGKTTTLDASPAWRGRTAAKSKSAAVLVNSPASRIFVPAEKREIGMVFQSYAIWPHMNVFQNVAFPLTQGEASC